MVNRWVSLPTRSVLVPMSFSWPQPSAPMSSSRTSRSVVAVTTTSALPAAFGVPDSSPVALSILSHLGPRSST